MKKKISLIVAGILVLLMGLTGCQSSQGLETDEVTISQYKGVEIEQVEEPAEITDDDVTAYIDDIRALNPVVTEITDRSAREGDSVNIDFVGKMDGEEFDGGSGEGYELVIGSGVFIDGFEDSIIGHDTGDTYDWEGQFPEDYGMEDLAGQDVVFTITVNEIFLEEDPELTDEFVQSVSETATTVEAYEDEVRQQLEEEAQLNYEMTIADAAWTVVLDNTEVAEYDSEELEDLMNDYRDYYAMMATYYGMEYEDFLTAYFGSEEDFESLAEEASQMTIKSEIATDAIAKKENLEVDDDTYDEMLQWVALANGYDSVDSLLAAAEGQEDELDSQVKQFMVRKWVGDHCIQVASEDTSEDASEEDTED